MTEQQSRASADRNIFRGFWPGSMAAHPTLEPVPLTLAMSSVLRVALPVPLPTLFDYLPPTAGEAAPGSRVLVPFGRGKAVGVVVETDVSTTIGSTRLKRALRVLDEAPLLDPELMQTLAWAADYWLGAPGEAYANALPLLLREDKPLPETREPIWQLTIAGRSALGCRQPARRKPCPAASFVFGFPVRGRTGCIASRLARSRTPTDRSGLDRTR